MGWKLHKQDKDEELLISQWVPPINGTFLKVLFVPAGPTQSPESMWLEIVDEWKGRLDNKPLQDFGVFYNDVIDFEASNVIDVYQETKETK